MSEDLKMKVGHGSSQVIEAGNKKLVLGLEWSSLSGVRPEREETRDICKELGATHFARSSGTGSEALVGTVVDVPASKLKGHAYSAAQAFASMDGVPKNAIMVLELDDERTWVCLVRGGLPVVGHDVVMATEDAVVFASDAMSFSEDSLTIFGNTDAFKSVKSMTLEDVAFSCGKDDEIKRVSGFSISPAAPLVILIIIGSVAGGGWWYMEQERIKEQQRLLAAQQADPNLLYDQELDRINPGMPVRDYWLSVKDQIANMVVFAGGWRLTGLDCDLVAGNCMVNWERVHGTNEDLIKFADLPADTAWTSDATKVSYAIKIKAQERPDAMDVRAAPKVNDLMVGFVSKIQDASLVGLNVSLKNLAPYALPPGVSMAGIKPEKLVMAGEWDLVGNYWMTEFIDEMPSNFSANKLNVTISGSNIQFNMKGNYYAKN